MKEIVIQSNDAGQRLDKFLSKAFPQMAKSMMYKGLRNKKIKVNRKRATYDQKLAEGDIIHLFLPEDALAPKKIHIQDNADLDIVYEDDNLLVVNKPAGLLCQKDKAEDQDTLNDRILAYLVKTKVWDPNQEQSFVPSVCHRLDRNTCGLVAAAKNAKTARMIASAIHDHKLGKEYLAIVQGTPKEQEAIVYLKKEGLQAKVSDTPFDGAAKAITDIQVLEEKAQKAGGKQEAGEQVSLLKLDLKTGRFHQIRATLSHLGHPLLGDVKYGGKKTGKPYQLQAYALRLDDISLPDIPRRIELPRNKQIHL